MALTPRRRNELIDAINVAFKDIGNVAPTKPPRTKSNQGPAAWEYFVARHLEGLAAGRIKQAKREAISAGVIFDHEKQPREPGTNEMIYTGEQVGVWLEVREPGTRIDTVRLVEHLQSKKVAQKVIDEAVAYATVTNKPAHVFRVSLLTNEAD